MSSVSCCSSSRPRGIRRCVERCCPSTRHTRRSDTRFGRTERTWSMQARRREGLRSFPAQPPSGSACPASDRPPPCEAVRSPSGDPSTAEAGHGSCRHIACATGRTSVRKRRSGERHPPSPCLGRAKPQPAEASCRSRRACVACLPLWSSVMVRSILQGGPVQWRWIILKHPNKLGPEAIANLNAGLEEFRSGGGQEGKNLILEEGMDYARIAMTAEDAQWIESRKFSDRKSTRLNSSHVKISYAVFCLKKKKKKNRHIKIQINKKKAL